MGRFPASPGCSPLLPSTRIRAQSCTMFAMEHKAARVQCSATNLPGWRRHATLFFAVSLDGISARVSLSASLLSPLSSSRLSRSSGLFRSKLSGVCVFRLQLVVAAE